MPGTASITPQERTLLMLTEAKILLVDGDEGIRKSLSLFFGSRDWHLRTVENATKALIATEKELYDIIICEHLLPDMNGLNFFGIINTRDYETIKILITSYGDMTTSENIHKKGIDCILTKPFSGDEIEANMVRLINSRSTKITKK